MILISILATCIINSKLYAQNEVVIEVVNPEYSKPVNESDNVEIGGQAYNRRYFKKTSILLTPAVILMKRLHYAKPS